MARDRQTSLWSASACTLIGLLSFLFLITSGDYFKSVPHTAVVVSREGLLEPQTPLNNLTKRLDPATYQNAITKGNTMHCLLPLTQAQAQVRNGGNSWEAPDHLTQYDNMINEGWRSDDNGEQPYHKDYLSAALTGIGSTGEMVYEALSDTLGGLYWTNPDDPDIDENPELVPNSEPTGAQFFNSFAPIDGVIIADKSQSVNAAMTIRYGPGWRALNKRVTYFQRWSDIAFVQWKEACFNKEVPISNIKYMFQSWITNHDTQEIVFQALINQNGGSTQGLQIGTWNNGRKTLTAQDNPDEFHAVLGSPNGSGQAFFLLTHKLVLGVKTINRIDIFVPNIPFPVIGTTGGGIVDVAKISLLFYVEDA